MAYHNVLEIAFLVRHKQTNC